MASEQDVEGKRERLGRNGRGMRWHGEGRGREGRKMVGEGRGREERGGEGKGEVERLGRRCEGVAPVLEVACGFGLVKGAPPQQHKARVSIGELIGHDLPHVAHQVDEAPRVGEGRKSLRIDR